MVNATCSNKVLRVLHVVGKMQCGGAETRLVELLKHIDRNKVQFEFCCLVRGEGYYESQIAALGGRIVRCPLGKNIFSFLWRFYRILKHGPYDVVHSHVLTFSGICLTVAKLAGVKKRIAHLRSTSDGKSGGLWRHFYRWLTKYLLVRNSTNIIGISTNVLTTWFGKDWCNNPKFKVVYNGLNTAPFHCEPEPDWLRREFDVPDDYKTILHVGRFAAPKNHTKVVSIAGSYLSENDRACFILVGNGKLRKAIENSVNSKGLGNNFRFAGVRPDVPRIMKSADAMLFPSLWEGLGGVVVEAVAAGLPMVVSDLPSIREIFDVCGHGTTLSVDESDVEWAKALEKAVNTPRQEQWLATVENSCFRIDNFWQSLKKIYEE